MQTISFCGTWCLNSIPNWIAMNLLLKNFWQFLRQMIFLLKATNLQVWKWVNDNLFRAWRGIAFLSRATRFFPLNIGRYGFKWNFFQILSVMRLWYRHLLLAMWLAHPLSGGIIGGFSSVSWVVYKSLLRFRLAISEWIIWGSAKTAIIIFSQSEASREKCDWK